MTKEMSLKNNKLEHVLLYHFLKDENHAQIVSPGNKKLIRRYMNQWKQLLLFVYTRRKKI